jgi:L,D-transpeptidase ErfK/SrfK
MKPGVKHSFCLTFVGVLLLASAAPGHAAYDKPYIGEMDTYRATYEDTFVHVARDYNLGYVEMRAANPNVDPWIPGAGTKLVLPMRHILPDAPREGIVINIPEMRLYAYINGDNEPSSFPIGVGREGLSTPMGKTTIVRKTEGPIWRPTERMRREKPELEAVVHPGPDNPMGTHAMYLGWPQYAIHGTNKPFGIGRRSSSGCIRMYPESIIELYDRIPEGTKVMVVNQPIKLAWIDDELFIEAHPTVEQANAMEETGVIAENKMTEKDMEQIIKAAGGYKDRIRWAAVRTAVRERLGYPVSIARRPSLEVEPEVSAEEEAVSEALEQKPIKATKAEKETLPSKEEIRTTLKEIYEAPVDEDDERKTVYDNGSERQNDPYSTLNP